MNDADTDLKRHTRAVVWLIIGFWAFYFALNTFRAWLWADKAQWHLLANRTVVSIIGIGLTLILWQTLKAVSHRSTRQRVAAVFLASLPIAIGYAAVNFMMFEVIAPLDPALYETKKDYLEAEHPFKTIVNGALNWYFFIVAWGMLYVALTYAERVRIAEREMANLRTAAQTAELRALRYQVNPHFLFNTLNSLSSLVLANRTQEAERMILNMSDFFRASLTGDPTDDVRLADEVTLQTLYLAIEQVRFPGRLTVQTDVAPDLENARIPGLLLQPLVENSVRHGVARTTDPVTVCIAAHRDGDRMIVTVSDDARGEGVGPNGHGVGVRNVCDRLKARFGEAAMCEHGPLPGGGYRVRLGMPIVR